MPSSWYVLVIRSTSCRPHPRACRAMQSMISARSSRCSTLRRRSVSCASTSMPVLLISSHDVAAGLGLYSRTTSSNGGQVRIGLTGGGASVDKVVRQAQQAEADGFTSLWYASIVTGDPLVAIALAGRETKQIELGTAVLQTYPCHPLLQANRAASVVDAMGRAGFTLGIGPSHEPVIRGVFGLSYDHPGRSTEEYVHRSEERR